MAKTRVSKAPEERRAELIAAARQLFDKDGVDKTRVSDIVHSVGVAQGVFYYYFHSKDEMVEVVADQVIDELESDMGAVLEDRGACFCKRLAGLLELYLNMVDQFTGDDALALPDFGSIAHGDSAPVQRVRAVLVARIQCLVLEGQKLGHVKAAFPSWTVRVLEEGLLQAAVEELPTRTMVYTLIEEGLCLQQGSLVKYSAKVHKEQTV